MPNALFGGNTFSPYNTYSSPYRTPVTTPYISPTAVAPTYLPQQPIMQNVQSMVPQSNIIWIDDVTQIETTPTGRGWQQWFGLKNEQILYVRDTDMNGVTQPLRKVSYQLVEEPSVDTKAETVNVSENTVTREEFNKLSETINNLSEKLSELLN